METKSRAPGVTDAHLRGAVRRARAPEPGESAGLSAGEKAAHKVFKWGAALTAATGCLLWLATAGAGHEREHQMLLAHQEGVPVSAEDLNPPAVPDSENAAPLFTQCFEILAPISQKDFDETMKVFPWPLPVATVDRLDRCRPLLAEALKRPYCRFGPMTLDNRLGSKVGSKTLFLFRILEWSARWRLYRGDVPGAMRDLKLQAGTIRALHESGKLTLYPNSDYDFTSRCLALIKLIVTREGGDHEIVRGAQDALAALGPFPAPKNQFRENVLECRERIWAYDLAAQRAHPKLGQRASDGDDCGIGGCGEPGFTIYGISAINSSMDARAIEFGRMMYHNLPPDPEDIVGLRKLGDALDDRISGGDWLDDFYNSLVFNPDSATDAGNELSRSRVLLVALRLLENGPKFPEDLPDMGRISLDPYTNKPLAYRRTPDGFVLYSVGPAGNYSDPASVHGSSPLSFQFPYVPIPKVVPVHAHRQIAPFSSDDD